jgi:hypothetical protein
VRVKIVFGLLLVLFVASGATMATRERVAHTAPAPPARSASESASAGAGPAAASASGATSAAAADAGPAKLMDRPLRIVALGWDLAAPAVLANRGLEPAEGSEFGAAGVPTYVKPVEAMSSIEGALARGGADKDGADVAVVPFADLVASYERLRALSPEVFFVVGWSRGREALVSTRDALPSGSDKPEGKPGDKPIVSLVGTAGEAAAFVGLFALDANGVAPGAVRLVSRGDKPDDPPLAAVDRDFPGETARHTILLTTADATRLVPFVAVAQHGLVDTQSRALAAWARVWLEATRKLEADPPLAARTIAAAPGAPEPIALLKRLGEIAPASLGDNARAFGLSGRGALTLDVLFQQAWRIWRGAGVLATPAPDAAPVNSSIIASLARTNPSLAAPEAMAKPKPPAAPNPDALKTLVTYRQPEGKVDEAALLSTAGLLADVFERSVLRVAVSKGGRVDAAATKHLVEEAAQRFDVAPGRIVAAKKAPANAGASVEILVAP